MRPLDRTSRRHVLVARPARLLPVAHPFCAGESEVIVGKALAGRKRDDVSLATKGTDRIGRYQVHRPDPNTDVEVTLAALTDLVADGKIRYFGHFTFVSSQLVHVPV